MSDRTASAFDAAPRDDVILPFQVGDTAVRGRIVRLGAAIDEILSRHPFEEPITRLIGEAGVLVAMMGSALKFDGRMIFQVQTKGALSMLVADYSAGGALRAMASLSDGADKNASDFAALTGGGGHIALTVDQGADMERYQGVAPLEGDSLSDAAVGYFLQSEQIPTAIKVAVGRLTLPGQAPVWRAGGIMAQFVPSEGGARERGEAMLKSADDQEIFDRAAAFLETTQADELLDPQLSSQELLYRLYHEDGVRVFDPSPVEAKCSCNADRIGAVLRQYSADDLRDMVEDGDIRVTCEFCRTDYRFDETGVARA